MKLPTLLIGLLLVCCGSASAEDAPPALAPRSFESQITLKLGYKYLLSEPKGYATDESKKWPLLVFLHGAGERGDDLNLLKKHGPPKLIAAGKEFEAIVVCPQVPTGEFWNPHGVKALVDEVRKSHRVDESRIYLTGISMGGFGTFDTIAAYPGVFAAAAPICGGAGINVVKFAPLKDMPIWIFHGAKDPVVPVAYSEMAMAWFKRNKAEHVKLTVYPEALHDSWTQTYDNPEVWKWLFEQRRAR
jgi:predicted peptidase